MNAKQIHRDWNADYYYSETYTKSGGRASDCIRCGKCEKVCPQHLHIRDLLADVAAEFEKRAERLRSAQLFVFQSFHKLGKEHPLAGFPPSAHR